MQNYRCKRDVKGCKAKLSIYQDTMIVKEFHNHQRTYFGSLKDLDFKKMSVKYKRMAKYEQS